MPLMGTEDQLGEALYQAAISSGGEMKPAWKKVAKCILDHIAANALVNGVAPPNGGPITEGKIS